MLQEDSMLPTTRAQGPLDDLDDLDDDVNDAPT